MSNVKTAIMQRGKTISEKRNYGREVKLSKKDGLVLKKIVKSEKE